MTASQCHRLKFAQAPHPLLTPSPLFLSLILHLLISLICRSKCHPPSLLSHPFLFYKTCTFMRPINGIVCTKTSTRWSIDNASQHLPETTIDWRCAYADRKRPSKTSPVQLWSNSVNTKPPACVYVCDEEGEEGWDVCPHLSSCPLLIRRPRCKADNPTI